MQPRNAYVPIVTKWLQALFAALTALILAFPAAAQLGGAGRERHMMGELVAETASPAPGETVILAFHMTPDPGWHGYWENPGDAGLGMTVHWTLPPGVTAGKLEYPVPGTLVLAGLMNHVYERDYAVLVPLHVPADMAKGTKIPVRVAASALVCDDKLCVPQDFSLTADLVAGDGVVTAERRVLFDKWRAKLARPLTLGSRDALFERSGDRVRIGVKLPPTLAIAAPHMFVATQDAVAYAAPQRYYRSGDWLVMETESAPVIAEFPQAIDTLLKIGPDTGLRFEARKAGPDELPANGTALAGGGEADFDSRTLLLAIGGALIGGVLLNIMPCVFPILSLKALSVARAGGDQASVRREAWGYAAGVIAVCLLLGAVILGLRAAGEQVGWAFQLQNPVSIFLLLLLVSGITANLAGWFEIAGPSISGSGQARSGMPGAFLSGALAAIVATPCTGPFMGAALGATMLLPGWAALVIFGALGAGLALPFLAIAYSARLRGLLPRPGPWMQRFRHWMALPMGLTALALAWLLWRMAGSAGFMAAILGMLVTALFAIAYGRGQRQGKGRGPLLLALFVISAALGSALVSSRAPVRGAAADLSGSPYSDAGLAKARASGKPVFVYFTADWCVTCKVNEAAAINRAETAAAFKKHGVTVLVGDWTSGDAAITRTLASHGRNSVPLYLWYRPGAAQPEIMPQLLTPAMLIERAEAR